MKYKVGDIIRILKDLKGFRKGDTHAITQTYPTLDAYQLDEVRYRYVVLSEGDVEVIPAMAVGIKVKTRYGMGEVIARTLNNFKYTVKLNGGAIITIPFCLIIPIKEQTNVE